MHASKVIDHILAEYLAPLMKQHGFRRKGQTFWKASDEVVEVLNLQKMWTNTKTSAQFTINLGVYVPGIGDGFHRVSTMPPKDSHCTIQKRIGFLFGKELDFWWEVRGIRKAPGIGEDMRHKVATFALPWLQSMHEPQAMLRYHSEHPSLATSKVVRYLERKAKGSNPAAQRTRASRVAFSLRRKSSAAGSRRWPHRSASTHDR